MRKCADFFPGILMNLVKLNALLAATAAVAAAVVIQLKSSKVKYSRDLILLF